jgi:Putative prokaryotic signal transducing protein
MVQTMNFISIRSYDNYIPAHIAMGRLRDEFISCYLENENSVTIDPFLSNAIGGIRLMVAETQVRRAIELLDMDDKQTDHSSTFPS